MIYIRAPCIYIYRLYKMADFYSQNQRRSGLYNKKNKILQKYLVISKKCSTFAADLVTTNQRKGG